MKKIVSLIILLSFMFPFCVYANEPDITPGAKSAVMIDCSTNEVLYDKNKDERRSVASLAKMMGLVLIFERIDNGSIKTNEILTTSKTAKEMGGTQIWLEEGEKISVNDLIKGITMASANDAMVLMAERVSGTESAFVKEMNEKAKSMGLKNTNFVNATGFDEEGGYSSAYDMAQIAKELLKHKKILDYTSKYEDYIREKSNKTWVVNTNKLVRFYQGADGLKTGYTDAAGSTIAVTAMKNNLRLIVINLGYSNTNDRNSESISLLDYGFNQYESKILFSKEKTIKEIKLNKANSSSVNLVLNEDVTTLLKKGESDANYTYDIKLSKISFPIKKGDKMGVLVLKKDNKAVNEYFLYSNKRIEKANIFKQYLRVLSDSLSGNI